MIKENKRILIITSLIILLPVLVGLLLWHQLPEQIPVHFNSEGVADSYQSKLWGVTFINFICLPILLDTGCSGLLRKVLIQ